MRFGWLIVAAAALLGCGNAVAQPLTLTQDIKFSNLAGSANYNKFDASLGVLEEVDLAYTVSTYTAVLTTGFGPLGTVTYIANGTFQLSGVTGAAPYSFSSTSMQTFDPGADFAISSLPLNVSNSLTFSAPSDVAQFYSKPLSGTGQIIPLLTTLSIDASNASGKLSATSIVQGEGFQGNDVTLTYVYFLPEPATWAMLIFGFGAIGGVMRRRPQRGVVAHHE